MRSMSLPSFCTLMACCSVRSTVPSKPFAVWSMYQCSSVSRCTSESEVGRPLAILRRTRVRRSTKSALFPFDFCPRFRRATLRSATVMLAMVGSASRAFSILAARLATKAASSSSSSSSSSSTAEKSISNCARGARPARMNGATTGTPTVTAHGPAVVPNTAGRHAVATARQRTMNGIGRAATSSLFIHT
eukprot:scaffold17376_cov118-Isochrysis_galbana.AAC.11